MENCTIYSHRLEFDKIVQIIKSELPKTKIEFNDGGKQKSLIATVKGGLFSRAKTLKINYRERENPSYQLTAVECGLTQNLAGMTNFIQSLPAENQQIKNKFLIKVMAANCEIPFIAEPKITPEFEAILKKILTDLEAFVFTQPSNFFNKSAGQYFADKNLKLILDTEGRCEIEDLEVNVDTKFYDEPSENYTEEQKTRKGNSESFLESKGIKVNKNLPAVADSENTELRTVQEVIDRTYALLIMSVKGEGIQQEHLTRTVKDKNINSFSVKEKEIYEAANMTDEQQVYATWRYESLYTMLWALGKMEDLKYPSEICDVQGCVGAILHPSREEFENTAQLRSKAEILDELDKIYRMNWACVDARIKGQAPGGNIHPSVVYERHYSLNWLTKFEDLDWDDVRTDT